MTMISLSVNSTRSNNPPLWTKLKELFKEWRRRARSRYELTTLNDRDLSDICLTRMDVHAEYEKPFWRR
jgi:uncharacterized protein YjiS (DUF1127 family)